MDVINVENDVLNPLVFTCINFPKQEPVYSKLQESLLTDSKQEADGLILK